MKALPQTAFHPSSLSPLTILTALLKPEKAADSIPHCLHVIQALECSAANLVMIPLDVLSNRVEGRLRTPPPKYPSSPPEMKDPRVITVSSMVLDTRSAMGPSWARNSSIDGSSYTLVALVLANMTSGLRFLLTTSRHEFRHDLFDD